ncbi:MAG: hypothetical protein HN353_08980 [Bdellovibrionales bacterium]|nr:hypothetical protein [Bdellovibrionales bacterium]MBT3525711.1 hypothetical protein [Bdellovibrionales bacterium]MBT7669260.1 hypothetical protein [Bdellovibrionales bacterium]MBT7767700.1 hypothetical protein [Bdellovibrionales bacterium]
MVLAIFLIMLSVGSLWAESADNTGPRLFNNALDMTISQIDFKRPDSGVGFAGKAAISKLLMFKDDMTMSLDNKENIFDSQIFIRKNFVGFKGRYTNIGFSLAEGHTLDMIRNGDATDSRVNMNAKRIHISAKHMNIQLNHIHLGLEKFRLYCKKHLDYPDISSESFVAACLNSSTLNAKNEGEISPVRIKFYNQGTSDEKVVIDTKLDSLEVVDNNISLKGADSKIDIIDNYLIQTGKFKLNCDKKGEILEFNSAELISKCQSGVDIVTNQLNVENRISGTSFVINPETIQIREAQFTLNAPRLEIVDPKEKTVLHNLQMSCFKDKETDALELDNVIDECLTSANINIERIDTAGNNKINELHNGSGPSLRDLLETAGFDTNKGTSKAKVKDLAASVSNSKLKLAARVHFLFKHFKLRVEGDLEYNREQDLLKLVPTKVKLPFGISSKKILLFFVRKFMVSESVTVVDDVVHIAL